MGPTLLPSLGHNMLDPMLLYDALTGVVGKRGGFLYILLLKSKIIRKKTIVLTSMRRRKIPPAM
jgi:hypothetical protein